MEHQTKVESLKDFQANFSIVPKENMAQARETDKAVLENLKLEEE